MLCNGGLRCLGGWSKVGGWEEQGGKGENKAAGRREQVGCSLRNRLVQFSAPSTTDSRSAGALGRPCMSLKAACLMRTQCPWWRCACA